MALTQAQKDLLHILRNKSGKNPEEEVLLKSLFELQMGDEKSPERVAKYTKAKNDRDNRS